MRRPVRRTGSPRGFRCMRTSVIPACLLASALVAACSDGGSPTTPTCNSCPCAPDAGATHIETPTGCSPGAPQTSAFDAPGASATATHFGPVQVGNTVQFDVPAGTASLTIVEQAV